jgi:glutathione synthase
MRFLFVMDPAEGMLPDKDTTFAFLRAAQKRGHTSFHCAPRDLALVGSRVTAVARPLTVSATAPHTSLGAPATLELDGLDAVFIRKDPPFDTAYLHLTQELDLVKHQTLVLNDPAALRDANEKLFAFHFERWMPRTLVTSRPADILAFVAEKGRAVLKPLDGAGGSGVVALTQGDRNNRALIDLLTHEGREQALVQEFQPAIAEGDKRVLVLDGEPLGAILRVPREDDIRANIHVGGIVKPTELTPGERELVADVGRTLSARGLWFVGLDLIGGKLIEVNVTSPTGIQELGRHTGAFPEDRVIEWVEGKAAALNARAAASGQPK